MTSSLLPPARRRLGHLARRQVYRAIPGPREYPTYFIVGAKRAGTTSLDEYLVDHPLVMRGLVEKGCRYYDVNYDRGPRWFRRHLPPRVLVDRMEKRLGNRPIVGESSPYYAYHPLAMGRIAAEVPAARIFFLLRDPVERAWSHYRYEVARGFEQLEFEQALEREVARLSTGEERDRAFAHRHYSYLGRSRYAEQLDHVYRHFAPGQVLVLESERLFTEPRRVVQEAFGHLGLPPHEQSAYPPHKALNRSAVPAGGASWLREQLADDGAELRELLDFVPTWM